MNDQEAFEELKTERPIIIAAMQRDIKLRRSAESLANSIITRGDTPELQTLIRQASRWLWQTAVPS